MASPNEVFTELVTTTLRNHSKDVDDNVSAHNAFYRRIKKKGKVTRDGGYEIVLPLEYAENSTYQRYSGYDTLNIQASDVFTAAKYDWVQASIAITASGKELKLNRGKQRLINLVRQRAKNARHTAANNMAIDIYSSGSLTNQMGGLAHLIQEDGTGTVGGINSTTHTWWRNKFKEATGDASSSTIKSDMLALEMSLRRGADRTDCIISSHDMFQLYWESLTDLQRYGPKDTTAGATIDELKFKTADVIFDDNSNFATNAEKMYFLNTDYLYLIEHETGKWGEEPKRVSINQDAETVLMLWMGQMATSNRSLQGVLIDNTDS